MVQKDDGARVSNTNTFYQNGEQYILSTAVSFWL
jgi:hypothetical protein